MLHGHSCCQNTRAPRVHDISQSLVVANTQNYSATGKLGLKSWTVHKALAANTNYNPTTGVRIKVSQDMLSLEYRQSRRLSPNSGSLEVPGLEISTFTHWASTAPEPSCCAERILPWARNVQSRLHKRGRFVDNNLSGYFKHTATWNQKGQVKTRISDLWLSANHHGISIYGSRWNSIIGNIDKNKRRVQKVNKLATSGHWDLLRPFPSQSPATKCLQPR